MKRFFSLALILVLILSAAAAEIDLSGLTFSELAALRDQCLMEMFTRDEWQEVTVPQGLWEVGVHIPAGTWTIRCSDIGRDDYCLKECDLRWGRGRPGDNYYWDYRSDKGDVDIYNPNSNYYSGEVTEFTITLEDGDFLYIHPQYNSVVFTPPVGPSFSFK